MHGQRKLVPVIHGVGRTKVCSFARRTQLARRMPQDLTFTAYTRAGCLLPVTYHFYILSENDPRARGSLYAVYYMQDRVGHVIARGPAIPPGSLF